MRRLSIKNILLPSLFVISGLFIGYSILESGQQKPDKHKKNTLKRVRTVQTSELVKGSVTPYWDTSGFVIPAESVKVYSRVSGNIKAINDIATPGGLLKKGQWLAKLDTIDFDLALASQESQLEQAKANYSLELVNQVLAKEELLLLNRDDGLNIDESLVLRQPQLTVAKSKISVAQNNVEKAQLNLERSTITMPFEGKITSKTVGVGSKVSTNTLMFSVVNTDVYWLEVKVPHKFLTLLDNEQLAELTQTRLWGEGKTRQASFVSILPELDTKDRQVKILLAINNPQQTSNKLPQVFINDFLNVQLKGRIIENAWTINHSWLQPDNSIWVVDQQNTLQKRAVKILFKGRDVIYVRARIQPGDTALAEKPGIASVGLVVKTRKELSNSANKNETMSPEELAKKKEKRKAKRKAKAHKGSNSEG